MAPLISLKNVSVSYDGGVVALNQISLQIQQGEKIAIVGQSGAGKSTLLKYLYEQHPHQSAFIPQDFALTSQLSVFHNVYAGRLNQHSLIRNIRNLLLPSKVDVKAVTEIVDKLQLDHKLYSKTAALSGGQQQRTAVGRALYQNAPMILGDEPVAAQDPQNARAILKLLGGKDKTVVLSLHAVELAMGYANRVIGLKGGAIFFDRAPSDIADGDIHSLFES